MASIWSSSSVSAQWTAPENVDPSTVLTEAKDDRIHRRYEDSLQKYIWLYRESHLLNPAFNPVRLSFAIGGWVDLAKVYTPARSELLKAREFASEVVASNSKNSKVDSFRNFDAICRELGEQYKSVELFKKVSAKDVELGRELFPYIRVGLFENKDYEFLYNFIDPLEEFTVLSNRLTQNLDRPTTSTEVRAILEQRYCEDVSGLVRMLLHRNEASEAGRLVTEAVLIVQDGTLQEALRKLMK
ncbi:hypothetical protein SH449x_001615 [Pirellulaceae bacterium SH449]